MQTSKIIIPLRINYQLMLVYILLGLMLFGCATSADKRDMMKNRLVSYEKAMRWGSYDAALAMHRKESGAITALPENMQYIRVTRYEVLNHRYNKDSMDIDQIVLIRYYNTETLREKSTQATQHWKYFEEEKNWYLLSEFPPFP